MSNSKFYIAMYMYYVMDHGIFILINVAIYVHVTVTFNHSTWY